MAAAEEAPALQQERRRPLLGGAHHGCRHSVLQQARSSHSPHDADGEEEEQEQEQGMGWGGRSSVLLPLLLTLLLAIAAGAASASVSGGGRRILGRHSILAAPSHHHHHHQQQQQPQQHHQHQADHGHGEQGRVPWYDEGVIATVTGSRGLDGQHRDDGQGQDGQGQYGHAKDDHGQDSQGQDGHAKDGHGQDGHAKEGHGQDGHGQEGHGQHGPGQGQTSQSQHSQVGLGQDGHGDDEFPWYQPKSTEPTVFNKSGRTSSPWSASALDSLRTSFHFQPQHNWINDPNAPLYYRGWYHLFYQYNPHDAFWGLISWGHAVSTDLIHWLYLDLAMVPDKWYDARGVWTGSATFVHGDGGPPTVLYTGSTNESVQVQVLAYPTDPEDSLLRNWTKAPDVNPVLTPPDGILDTDFRDPTTAWLGQDGLWRFGMGSKINDTGVALIYLSPDFVSWTLQEHYLYQVEGTGMWECLDFYPIYASGSRSGVDTSDIYRSDVAIKHVIKASMDNTKLDFYTLGRYDYGNHTFAPDNPPAALGSGPRYDYGKFYASKTFYDPNKGRRVLWGWVNESDSLQDDIAKGWASVLGLPRQVWFDNLTQSNLIQWPVEELLSLRGSNTSIRNVVLEAGSVAEVPRATGAQWDIELTIDNPILSRGDDVGDKIGLRDGGDVAGVYSCAEAGASRQGYYGPFGLLVLASDDLQEQTAVYFYFTSIDGKWTALVCNDQSRSTVATDVDKSIYGSFVPVLEDETTLSLRVLVDHSIVETFAQGGRVCITSRVYPTVALDDDAKLFLFNNGTASVTVSSLDAWRVSSANLRPF